MERYLRHRGDANIRSNSDLINQANWYDDPSFPSLKNARAHVSEQLEVNTAERMLRRFATQEAILQCMEEQHTGRARISNEQSASGKIGAPAPPPINGRGNPPADFGPVAGEP